MMWVNRWIGDLLDMDGKFADIIVGMHKKLVKDDEEQKPKL